MANIFDYLDWRGDISLKYSNFNEIDNLILARLAYFPFDSLIKKDEKITIQEAFNRFEKNNLEDMKILQKEDITLFPALAYSNRFGKMILSNYVNKINIEEEKQFSAITITMPDDTLYIAYRGTDNTLVGWKEDFNMGFKSHLFSQIDSVKYLEDIAKKYSNNLRVGGHSKGGNLAVYAAIFANKDIKNRIIKVYNNDGPGFNEDIIRTKEYKEMLKKIHTFIPQSSVIGRLLNHNEEYTILKSSQTGLMQHDLYTWELLGTNFIYLEKVTYGSQMIDKTLKNWFKSSTQKQREQFVDVLFDILDKTGAKNVSDLSAKKFASAILLLKTYKNIDEENKEILTKTLKTIIEIATKNLLKNN